MGIFSISKGTRIVISVMTILTIIGVVIAWKYYSGLNKAVDPRIKEALVLYGKYNRLVTEGDHEEILALLDTIESVYQAVPHYHNSYEIAVLHNNRASILLSAALLEGINDEIKADYMSAAEQHLVKGIDNYTRWLKLYENKSEDDLIRELTVEFNEDSLLSESGNLSAIISRRKSDIINAVKETPRRLSVSYTNMGIIQRHQGNPEEAAKLYLEALDLWEENMAAKNNLNILLDKPLEKRGLLRRLFPPDRL